MNPAHRDRLGHRSAALLVFPFLLLGLFAGAAAGFGESRASAVEPQAAPYEVFETHLKVLNEFEDRRRSNVYFKNEQSLFYGAQVGHVNVGKGNLTFLRRDLVTVGRIPLVVSRVYDSSLAAGGGFGRGWRLAAAESLTLRADGSALLTDESGTTTDFLAEGERLVADPPRPSDLLSFRRLGPDRFRLRLATGFVKDYALESGAAARSAGSGQRFVLTRVADRNGNAVTLSYRGGYLTELRDQDGRRVTLAHGKSGRIDSACDEQARCVVYKYDDRGLLGEVLDLGGKAWRYAYDDSGRLVRALDPAGRVSFTAAYDDHGRAVHQRGLSAGHRFDYAEGVTLVTDAKKRRSLYRQNPDGITIAVRNARGVATEVELDGRNRVRRLYRDSALELELAYRADGRLASLTQAGGAEPATRLFEYDRQGRLAKVSGDVFLRLAYDARGNVLERIDAEGRTVYGYTERGDLATLSRLQEAGRGASPGFAFEHDAYGQITSIVSPDGARTELGYRSSGQLAEVRYADGSSEVFGYDGLGLRLHRKLGSGGSVEYDYSPAGSILEVRVRTEDGTAGGQTLTIDESQRVTKIRDHSGKEVDVTYDAAGNVTAMRKDGEPTIFRYDAQDRLAEVVTAKGAWLRYDYAEGEVDLRIQADRKTRENPSPRISTGLSFASSYEVLYNRTARSDFGPVTLDASLAEFRLTADLGAVPADAVILTALSRMRILGAEPAGETSFGEPSNILFVPAEYASLNCCNPVFCLTCSPDPRSRCYDDGGGGGGGLPQATCTICCAVQGTTCRNTRDAAVDQAWILFAIAEGACIAGVCTTQGPDSAACIACNAAAVTALVLRLNAADAALEACCAARTNVCRLSTNNPACSCFGSC